MNTKKCFVAALAAAVAVSSAAVSVGAIAPGTTTNSATVKATAVAGVTTHFSVTIEGVTIDADVPADVITAGEEITFGANTITNVDIETAVANLSDPVTSKLLDVYFLDADGESMSFKDAGVDVTVTTSDVAYDTIYVYEEATGLNKLATADGNKMNFKAPHFSYYVLTKVVEEPSQQPSQQPQQQSQTPGQATNTGDSSATAGVFAVVGLAALGTALVASKSKKHAK